MDYSNKVILITGGTGSFGSNFIANFLKKHTPKRIRIYSRDEHKQATLLENPYYGGVLDGFIGDVRDKERLRRAMDGVDIVLHAAALKRVQACEYNPFETVKTNILGSMNVVDCAIDAGVEKVLLISTDKAVSPLNLYGATKMCMEKLAVNANSYCGKKKTKISCVRYGNVAGARGSVIPYWKDLFFKNQVIPITDGSATRFWMDIPKAIDFVVDALEVMETHCGGEIYVPMLPSFKIMDLFHAMFPLGEFTITGNRVGDKLHETLVSKNEMNHTIDLEHKFIIYPEEPKWEYFLPKGEGYAISNSGRRGYSSDTNDQFLSVEELKEKLAKVV
jgi:UDP-N-acetylglucosamine 4,6-dehydratase